MKSLGKKIVVYLSVFIGILGLCSCESNEQPDKTPEEDEQTIIPLPPTVGEEEEEYVYEGTLMVAPFTIYNEDGTKFGVYNNMFDAIRVAGDNASSKNRMYVNDGNNLQIFQRQASSKCWCYDGQFFVGSKSRTEALEWGKNKTKCYIIDGQGTGYVMLGAYFYKNSDMNQNIPLELNTGAYNYMFTKSGVMENGQWAKPGYGYMECNARLSEATYTPTAARDGAWNVYVFINAGGGTTCDLGLMGVVKDGKVVFVLVRNCGHSSHTVSDRFKVLSWEPVTTMEYDEAKGVYCGADDLFFQCWQTIDGWKLDITNLRTNKVYTINEKHGEMLAESTPYLRFLLAASYVPEVGDIWNARNQATLRNVIFDHVYIARFNPSNVYDSSSFEEFYPDSDNMIYGFSQGGDCASMIYDTHDSNGQYLSGNSYNAGEKFISFSVYYDGGGHYHNNEE